MMNRNEFQRILKQLDTQGFAITQPVQNLGFPRYKIYFFNTTERPASVNLYAYLAN